jgi:large subunit ribosomal protein L20
MPRVKGGAVTRRRRKKILKLAKGYFGSRRTLYRTAHEQVMHSLKYAYRDRKQRKREFRKLWISRINAGAKLNGMKYSTLIHGLSLASVAVNRKMLADIAVHQPEDFEAYCKLAKDALEGTLPEKTDTVATKAADKQEKAEDYDSMLVKDLKELAKDRGIANYSTMVKADLIEALKDQK